MVLEKVVDMSLPAYFKGKISEVSISGLMNDYLVLVFYPYDFTVVCPSEINEFSRRSDEFLGLGSGVAFVSGDSVYSHRNWAETPIENGGIEGVKWPMLSDYKKELSVSLSLLNADGSCRRATVIVDKTLKIRHYSYNDNNIGRSVVEVLRLLNAIVFYDTRGEMCLVDWEKSQNQ